MTFNYHSTRVTTYSIWHKWLNASTDFLSTTSLMQWPHTQLLSKNSIGGNYSCVCKTHYASSVWWSNTEIVQAMALFPRTSPCVNNRNMSDLYNTVLFHMFQHCAEKQRKPATTSRFHSTNGLPHWRNKHNQTRPVRASIKERCQGIFWRHRRPKRGRTFTVSYGFHFLDSFFDKQIHEHGVKRNAQIQV